MSISFLSVNSDLELETTVTDYRVGTMDEYRFFRVMRFGASEKTFYETMHDYTATSDLPLETQHMMQTNIQKQPTPCGPALLNIYVILHLHMHDA